MRLNIKVLICLIVFILANKNVFAIYGGQPGALFAYGAEGRSFAMGRAYAAIGDDAASVYQNPASMMEIPGMSLSFMNASMFEAYGLTVMSFVWPGLYESYGFSMVSLANSVPGIAKDENNNDDGAFVDTRSAMCLAYAKRLYHNLAVGLTFKMYNRTLGAGEFAADSWMIFDLGIHYKVNSNFEIGGVLNNVYVMNNSPLITSDVIPLVCRGGLKYKEEKMMVVFDVTDTFSQWHLGVEYEMMKMLKLRAGANYQEITFGMGVDISIIRFDLAMCSQEAGGSMKISFAVNLDSDMDSKINKEVDQLLIKAGTYYDKGFYNLARESYKKIGIISKMPVDVINQIKKLDGVINLKKISIEKERNAWQHFNRAREELKRRKLQRAYNEAQKAQKLLPGNFVIHDFVLFLRKAGGG